MRDGQEEQQEQQEAENVDAQDGIWKLMDLYLSYSFCMMCIYSNSKSFLVSNFSEYIGKYMNTSQKIPFLMFSFSLVIPF